jgi:hypothetical protein
MQLAYETGIAKEGEDFSGRRTDTRFIVDSTFTHLRHPAGKRARSRPQIPSSGLLNKINFQEITDLYTNRSALL